MKAWVVRFVSLYVFNVVALLLVGLLPGIRVGWAALWGGVILTALTIWLKPLFNRLFGNLARGSALSRKVSAKIVEYLVVLGVALAVWILLVLFTGVSVRGWFWGWLLGPFALLIVWAIYDVVDDAIEKHTGDIYDRATGRGASPSAEVPASPQSRASTDEARRELRDGLTDEQRRLFDQL